MDRRSTYIAGGIIILLLAGFSFLQLIDDNNIPDPDHVKIGVVDSGCAEQQGYVLDFTTFVDQQLGYPFNENSPYDVIGHGTEICNLIYNTFSEIDIYSAKVAAYNGYISYDGVITAIEYLIEEAQVDIINLSLGGPPYQGAEFEEIFDNHSEILFVAATGNSGSSSEFPEGIVDWPANLANVIGVASSDASTDNSLTTYSSRGRSSDGTWVVEFVDDGQSNIGRGTSFAAPRITAKFANLLYEMRAMNLDYSISSLTALMAKYSSNNLVFSSQTGWGQPELPSTLDLSTELVLLELPNNTTQVLRYFGEEWKETWKIVNSTRFDPANLVIGGNGSHFVTSTTIHHYYWGSSIITEFNITSESGSYAIEYSYANLSSTIFVEIATSAPKGEILLDHRNGVAGYSHPFGEFSELENYLRSNGYIVHHLIEGQQSLDGYRLVLATNFGQFLSDSSLEITKAFDQDLFDSYIDYLHLGGNLSFFLNPIEETNTEYIDSMASLGADLGMTIPDTDGSAILISNFSTSLLVQDIDSLFFTGVQIEPLNSSVSSLGWYRKQIFNGVTFDIEYQSIGIEGNLESGNYWILGSTIFLTNNYFHKVENGSNKFLDNLLLLV